MPPKNGSPSGVIHTFIGQPPDPLVACTNAMQNRSTSGRSSRSTFTLTKCSLSSLAVCGFSKDSRAMTWHQWQVEYPMETKTGLFSCLARSNASFPHGYQSTGLSLCCKR